MEENDEPKFIRETVDFVDFKRFHIYDKTFNRQYSNIYSARLEALKPILKAKAVQKWGQHKILGLSNLSDADSDQELVIVIGTLYKHQELKPSILKELSQELQLTPQPSHSNYSSEKDCLFLEDETLRVKLVGSHVNPKYMVTGLVCAILGHESDDGTFWVEGYCLPGMCPAASTSNVPCKKAKILLLSGLDMANVADSIEHELLVDWITGIAGNSSTQRDAASISLVIIAGNSVRGTVETYVKKGYSAAKHKNTSFALEATLATHRFDELLSQIVSSCCVLVMPGQFDPSNHSLPQQPFSPCILPQSSRYKSYYATTNPWVGNIGGVIVAGSSGQPVDDIMKVAGLAEDAPLDWLEKTLSWRHYAPTAPDTLSAYPYFGSDPFVMQDCPAVYFVGNMEDYATKTVMGEEGQLVRLISIPKFSKTRKAVIVDLESLEASPISFQAN